MEKVNVLGTEIAIKEKEDYISLTDIAKYKKSRASCRCYKKLDKIKRYHRILRVMGTDK